MLLSFRVSTFFPLSLLLSDDPALCLGALAVAEPEAEEAAAAAASEAAAPVDATDDENSRARHWVRGGVAGVEEKAASPGEAAAAAGRKQPSFQRGRRGDLAGRSAGDGEGDGAPVAVLEHDRSCGLGGEEKKKRKTRGRERRRRRKTAAAAAAARGRKLGKRRRLLAP